MKVRTMKRIGIAMIIIAIIICVTFSIFYFTKYNTTKKIEKLKKSTITYLGRDDSDNFVYMGNDGKTYIFSQYTSMQNFDYETVNARKDGLEGIISNNNKVLVQFGKYYDILDQRVCGSYVVQNEEGKYGLLSYEGKVLLDTVYDNITTFGEDVPVFKVKNGDNYFILTVYGDTIYDTKNSSIVVEFGEKLNKNSDSGLVKVVDDETEMIFDVVTGKLVYTGKNLSVSYNVIKDNENNRYLIIDSKGNEKHKVDYIAGEESIDLKLDKYIVIESKAGFYEVFNKKFEKVLQTERKPVFFENYKKDIYILNNIENGVEIYKDDKLYNSLSGYEYTGENIIEYGSIFGLKNIETEKVDLFNLEFEKLKEDVLLDKIYPKYVLCVDSESNKYIYTISKEEIKLGNNISMHALNTNATFNDYVLVSKSNNDIYEMLDLKGNSVIKNISNVEVLLDNNIIITDNAKGDMYLFNVDKNKEIFRFEKDKYDKAYEDVQTIKLKTGYFNYNGEQIAKIEE